MRHIPDIVLAVIPHSLYVIYHYITYNRIVAITVILTIISSAHTTTKCSMKLVQYYTLTDHTHLLCLY